MHCHALCYQGKLKINIISMEQRGEEMLDNKVLKADEWCQYEHWDALLYPKHCFALHN